MFYDITKNILKKADSKNPRNSEATVIECNDGSLLVAWQRFEGSSLGSSDRAPSTISAMRSNDGGKNWSDERVIVNRFNNCVNLYSPCFLRLNDGGIMLIYLIYVQLERGLTRLSSCYYQISYDEGETFSERKVVWEKQAYSMANDCVRRLSSGRIIIPLTGTEGALWTSSEKLYVTTIYSDNEGKTWHFSDCKLILPLRGAMEPFLAQSKEGMLVMLMRNQLGSVFKSYSYDEGVSWSKPQTTGLKCPESCAFITSIPNSGNMLVIWNNSDYDMSFKSHFGKRSPLTAAITSDGAKTFSNFFDIETDPNFAFTNPAVTFTKDGKCILTYWTCPYTEEWEFKGLKDLKIAIFKIKEV